MGSRRVRHDWVTFTSYWFWASWLWCHFAYYIYWINWSKWWASIGWANWSFSPAFPSQRWRRMVLFYFGLRSFQEAGSRLQMTIFPALSVHKMKPSKWRGDTVLPAWRPSFHPQAPSSGTLPLALQASPSHSQQWEPVKPQVGKAGWGFATCNRKILGSGKLIWWLAWAERLERL